MLMSGFITFVPMPIMTVEKWIASEREQEQQNQMKGSELTYHDFILGMVLAGCQRPSLRKLGR
jgi:hypothetical protein